MVRTVARRPEPGWCQSTGKGFPGKSLRLSVGLVFETYVFKRQSAWYVLEKLS